MKNLISIQINLKDKDFLGLIYGKFKFKTFKSKNYTTKIFLNNNYNFNFISIVNRIFINGGINYVNWIIRNYVSGIKTKLKKKYKNFISRNIENLLNYFKLKLRDFYLNFIEFVNKNILVGGKKKCVEFIME